MHGGCSGQYCYDSKCSSLTHRIQDTTAKITKDKASSFRVLLWPYFLTPAEYISGPKVITNSYKLKNSFKKNRARGTIDFCALVDILPLFDF